MASHDDLASRITRIEDHLSIEHIEGRYSETWDFGDALGWAGLYTENGVFEMLAPGGECVRRVEGRAALEAFCLEFTGQVTGLHLLHQPRITLDGDTASSHIHFTFESHRETPLSVEMATVTGVYRVTYARTGEGWHIVRRVERAMNRSMRAHHPGSYSQLY